MTVALNTPLALIEEIGKSGNDIAKMHISAVLKVKTSAEDDMDGNELEVIDAKMLAGIGMELINHLIVFSTDCTVIDALTPGDDPIVWEDLKTGNIFLSVDEDKLEQWGSVITLMLTQLVRSLERFPEQLSEEGKALPPILLILDEFPRLGKLEVIKNALSTLRSKGVTICLMIQNLAQLDAIYGADARRIIVDACQYKAILNATEADTQKYFSNLVGSIKVGGKSLGVNYDSDENCMDIASK